MPLCFSDCMPSGCYQYSSGGYSAAKLSALSQYENTSSRSERNVGSENREHGEQDNWHGLCVSLRKGNNVTLGEAGIADVIVYGPDPAKHIEKIQAFAKAGYDHVYVHQVGPDQEGFPNFMNRKSCQSFGRHYM
jgi:hypothetical protein